MFCKCLHRFIPKHRSYCAADAFHHQHQCLHCLTLHNTAVAVAHGDRGCDDGDGDDAGCDPVVVVFVAAAALVVALVPCLIGLPVLPANTDFRLTVMWMVSQLVHLFLALRLHHCPQPRCKALDSLHSPPSCTSDLKVALTFLL